MRVPIPQRKHAWRLDVEGRRCSTSQFTNQFLNPAPSSFGANSSKSAELDCSDVFPRSQPSSASPLSLLSPLLSRFFHQIQKSRILALCNRKWCKLFSRDEINYPTTWTLNLLVPLTIGICPICPICPMNLANILPILHLLPSHPAQLLPLRSEAR